MGAFILRRLLWLIPTLFILSLITFGLMHAAPGGPWDTDPSRKQLDPRTERLLNQKFGLDKPVFINVQGEPSKPWTYLDSQFFNYIWKVVTQFDFGPSYRRRGVDVADIIKQGMPHSMKLGLMAFLWSSIIGILLGLTAALNQNTPVDYVSLFIATILRATPNFVLGIFLIIIFGSWLHWVNIIQTSWDGFRPYLLPSIVLGAGTAAAVARYTRASMLDVIRQDYIRTARAKGLGERMVVFGHMLRNALIPVVTILGPTLAALVTGSFIIENLFGVPGIGRLFIEAINARDYSMIMGTTLFYAFLVAIANLFVDVTYAFIDPRIRLS
jgi:oligopeptide transport system permease protein